jgi:SAM-dependent methyltransferase
MTRLRLSAEILAAAEGNNATDVVKQSVLHIGCGPAGVHRLHPVFQNKALWHEVRLDLDPAVKPDIICSTADMRAHVKSDVFDAVWSSHNIEHLADHDVPLAFAEVARVLRPDGYFLVRCPDLIAVVEAIQHDGLETVAYISPAGPITPLDMLFGHRASVARGSEYMAHRTGFSDLRLGRLLVEAGFESVNTKRAAGFDLWAVAFKNQANARQILADLARHGLSFEE